jgi:hypothetical protein
MRVFVERHSKDTVYVTPRASMNGAALLREGFDEQTVCDWCIFNALSKVLRESAIAEVGYFKRKPKFVEPAPKPAPLKEFSQISHDDFYKSYMDVVENKTFQPKPTNPTVGANTYKKWQPKQKSSFD